MEYDLHDPAEQDFVVSLLSLLDLQDLKDNLVLYVIPDSILVIVTIKPFSIDKGAFLFIKLNCRLIPSENLPSDPLAIFSPGNFKDL